MRLVETLAVIAGLLVLIFGLAFLFDASLPNSTSGVSAVSDNTERLPAGEELILTHTVGKVVNVWHITYDGDQTVTFDGSFWEHQTATLCGVGCTTDFDMGLGEHIDLTQESDGAVIVEQPSSWLWHYRPHRS